MGTKTDDGQWEGLIGKVVADEFDAIIAEVDITARRLAVLDHIYPLLKSRFHVFYLSGVEFADWFAVFRPFNYDVWISLAFYIILVTVVATLVNATAVHNGLPTNTPHVSFSKSFFFVLRTVCFQGSFKVPTVWACRFIFVICYLTASVILPSYSAGLISSLTKKTPNKPFDDLEGMVGMKYQLLFAEKSGPYEYFADHNEDPLIKKAYKELVLPSYNRSMELDFYKAFEFICLNRGFGLVTLESEPVPKLESLKKCRFVQFSKPLGRVQQSIAFQKNSPYVDLMNYNVLKTTETGIVQKHYKFYMHKKSDDFDHESYYQVNIKDIMDVLFIPVFGVCISTVILLWEIYTHRNLEEHYAEHYS